MRVLTAPAALTGLLLLAACSGGGQEQQARDGDGGLAARREALDSEGKVVKGLVPCYEIVVGALLPTDLVRGCSLGGLVLDLEPRRCTDGRLFIDTGNSDAHVSGILGTVAQGGDPPFFEVLARCTGMPVR